MILNNAFKSIENVEDKFQSFFYQIELIKIRQRPKKKKERKEKKRQISKRINIYRDRYFVNNFEQCICDGGGGLLLLKNNIY